jgi:superfamily II DNA/RNA helicase
MAQLVGVMPTGYPGVLLITPLVWLRILLDDVIIIAATGSGKSLTY